MRECDWLRLVTVLMNRGDVRSLTEAGNLFIMAPVVREAGTDFITQYRNLYQSWRRRLAQLSAAEQALVERRTLGYASLVAGARPRRRVTPSVPFESGNAPGPITDREALAFLSQLDDEDSIRAIAVGPGAIDEAGHLRGPVLASWAGANVRTTDVVPLYRPKVRIERPWSGPYVRWERAVLEDSFLARAAVRGCLTSPDRNCIIHSLSPYFRAPLGGRLAIVGLTLTKRLERWGYLERVSTMQWRPTLAGSKAAREQLLPAWQNAGKPRGG